MKKILLVVFISTLTLASKAQDDTLRNILDSIVKEADLMYNYERAVWRTTDIVFFVKKSLKRKYGGYVVYHSNDTITVTFVHKKGHRSIGSYRYTTANLNLPFDGSIVTRALTPLEMELWDIKQKMLRQLLDRKYGISTPAGFTHNFILIREPNRYKLYLIMGTSKHGVIPFGNDYLFWADLNGNITNWKKFHSGFIPAYCIGPNGESVVSVTHSHLRTTPYITATDICTFRLYSSYCKLGEFSVYCTATGKFYRYDQNTHRIEIEDR